MIGPTPFRDILLVAGFELREMLRTFRALVVIAIYTLGGLVASRVFVALIARFEDVAAEMLNTTTTATPGALTNQLMKSEGYRAALMRFFPNREVADFLLGLPPIVLFFAWSSMAFIPFLIVITAADTVTHETQTRAIRFTLFRTGRLELVVGKYLGQAFLMALVTLMTGFVYMGVAAWGLQGFDFWETLHGILIFWPRVVCYGIAFVGLSGLCAMNAGSTYVALARALIGLIGAWILGQIAYNFSDGTFGPVWELVGFLVPFGHKSDLWSPDLSTLIPACAILLALSALYLAGGLLVFRRKDL